ncbi:MAG: zinc ribbon domain-containing protein [Oscillospiraceae bacterium]|nr:zinc ribbon domain-containing protein [Oscillospiraceae bacterium]
MMDMSIKKLLREVGRTASFAADEAKSAMGNAGKAVSNTADLAKANLQLLNLRADQEDIFAEIGKTMYLLNSGALKNDAAQEDGGEAGLKINRLLMKAAEKQSEIDYYTEKLAQRKGGRSCPACGKKCREDDAFCPSCGQKLKSED